MDLWMYGFTDDYDDCVVLCSNAVNEVLTISGFCWLCMLYFD